MIRRVLSAKCENCITDNVIYASEISKVADKDYRKGSDAGHYNWWKYFDSEKLCTGYYKKPAEFSGLLCLQGFSVNKYMLKVNNKNTRKRCEIYSKLVIDIFLVYLLLTLNRFPTFC